MTMIPSTPPSQPKLVLRNRNILEYPSQSPDFNPIEHFCGIYRRAWKPLNISELEAFVRDKLANNSPAQVHPITQDSPMFKILTHCKVTIRQTIKLRFQRRRQEFKYKQLSQNHCSIMSRGSARTGNYILLFISFLFTQIWSWSSLGLHVLV